MALKNTEPKSKRSMKKGIEKYAEVTGPGVGNNENETANGGKEMLKNVKEK